MLATHADREAARLFAKILGHIETHGWQPVATAATRALTDGTPVLLALTPARVTAALETPAIPPALRDLEVASGQAADYDTWLTAVSA